MNYQKTIVLQSVGGGNEKAVLNIHTKSGEVVGEVKLYNFISQPSGVLSLGIKDGDNIIKAGLTNKEYMKYDFKLSTLAMPQDFSCAVLNICMGEITPILQGSTKETSVSEQFLAKAVLNLKDVKNATDAQKLLDDNNIHLEDMNEIENEIDEAVCSTNVGCNENCTTCRYRDVFFNAQEEVLPSFYESIKEEMDKLFSSGNDEEFLKEIIPNSKWVKIESDDDASYYVLGLIYENDVVKYICYGVPSMHSKMPPKELEGYAEWLPLDSSKENEYGYYLTYQDANSGENVKASFTLI